MQNNEDQHIVSVIVPVFNVESYIEKCLTSIINQTYKNLDIILIDDGSLDKSGTICRRYAEQDKRIKLITSVNQGPSKARNIGLLNAVGDYLFFVDGDDWLDLNCIEVLVLETLINRDADIVMFPYIKEYDENSIIRYLFQEPYVYFDEKSLFFSIYRRLFGPYREELKNAGKLDIFSTVWGKLYKRQLVTGIEFEDIKKIGSEDLWFNIETIKRAKSGVYISTVFYHYRKDNPASVTTLYQSNLINQKLYLFSKMKSDIETYQYDVSFVEALNNRIALSMIQLGLNELNVHQGYAAIYKNIKKILNHSFARKCFNCFSLNGLSFEWKLFFFSCKYKLTVLVFFFLVIMKKIRSSYKQKGEK